MENRDYKFTDEQVMSLGFSSYEELEKYYDILGDEKPLSKQQCVSEIVNMGLEYRLDLPRRERLQRSIQDSIGVMMDWNATDWIPSQEEVVVMKKAINRSIDIYCNFVNKQAELSCEDSELSAPKFGGR